MLKKTFLLCCASLLALASFSQTVEESLAQAKQLTLQMKETEALQQYKDILQADPGNVTALNQSSLICSREGARQKDKSAKMEWFNNAKIFAYEAMKVDVENPESNYAMALAWARIAQISGAKEKVAAAKEVKKYVDLAIKFKPDYGEAFHLLGKWNFDIYNLSSIEKAAAKVLFGGMPAATLEDAIANYEKCRQLTPGFILNYLDLAIAFRQNNQETQAMEILNKAMRLRPIYQDDPGYKAECKKLLDSMQ